jgi:N-acetylglutamate synthase-like GNAT family acetyltransferase
MSKRGYSFFLSQWDKKSSDIKQIRQLVFVNELGLSPNHITNDSDPESYHVLAYNGDGEAIGTGCIHPDGKIGQIAVLKPWRGRTVGKAVLIYLLQIAKTLHLPSVWVNAPEPTVRFYKSKDFELTDEARSIDGFHYCKMVHLVEQKKTLN